MRDKRCVGLFAFTCLLVAAILLPGCGESASPQNPAADPDARRIVSLAPAISQMIVDLKLADELVGIAEHDFAAPHGLPVVGNFMDVQTEALLQLQPKHVLMMGGKAGAPPRLQEMADSGYFELVVYPYPDTVDELTAILAGDVTYQGQPVRNLGEILAQKAAAAGLRDRVLTRLKRLEQITAPLPQRSVLMVIGTNPVMASGPGSVNHELLHYAGGINAAGEAKIAAPTFDREALVGLQPDVILLLLPAAPPLTTDDDRLTLLRDLPIPAVQQGRVELLNDPLIVLPSTTIDRVAAQMAKAIHPERIEAIDAIFASDEDR